MIELLGVVTVIALLAALVIGIAGYVRLKAMKNRARAEIAVISATCEAFKADVGRYPTSSVYRMTRYPAWDYYGGWYELYNSSFLGSQLVGGGYLGGGLPIRTVGGDSPFDVCHTVTNKSVWTQVYPTTFTNLPNVIIDPWERPYNYFCTYPVNPAVVQTTIQTLCTYQGYTGTNPATLNSTNYPSYTWVGGQVNVTSFDLWSYGPNMRSCPAQAPYLDYSDDDIGNFQY